MSERVAVSIKLSQPSQALLLGLGKRASRVIDSAHRKAASSAARKMRAEVNRQVRLRLALPLKTIQKNVSVNGPSIVDGMASYAIEVRHSLTPIADLKPRQTRKGVSFRVKRGGKRSMLQGAFIATVGAGHVGVFQRAKGGSTKTKAKNGQRKRTWLPIRKQFTATVHGVFSLASSEGFDARAAVQRVGETEYQRTFDRIVMAEWKKELAGKGI